MVLKFLTDKQSAGLKSLQYLFLPRRELAVGFVELTQSKKMGILVLTLLSTFVSTLGITVPEHCIDNAMLSHDLQCEFAEMDYKFRMKTFYTDLEGNVTQLRTKMKPGDIGYYYGNNADTVTQSEHIDIRSPVLPQTSETNPSILVERYSGNSSSWLMDISRTRSHICSDTTASKKDIYREMNEGNLEHFNSELKRVKLGKTEINDKFNSELKRVKLGKPEINDKFHDFKVSDNDNQPQRMGVIDLDIQLTDWNRINSLDHGLSEPMQLWVLLSHQDEANISAKQMTIDGLSESQSQLISGGGSSGSIWLRILNESHHNQSSPPALSVSTTHPPIHPSIRLKRGTKTISNTSSNNPTIPDSPTSLIMDIVLFISIVVTNITIVTVCCVMKKEHKCFRKRSAHYPGNEIEMEQLNILQHPQEQPQEMDVQDLEMTHEINVHEIPPNINDDHDNSCRFQTCNDDDEDGDDVAGDGTHDRKIDVASISNPVHIEKYKLQRTDSRDFKDIIKTQIALDKEIRQSVRSINNIINISDESDAMSFNSDNYDIDKKSLSSLAGSESSY